MHRNTGKLTWHSKKSPSLSNVFVACLLMAIWHLSRDGVEKKEREGREREEIVAVSYTHLTLPTNREV